MGIKKLVKIDADEMKSHTELNLKEILQHSADLNELFLWILHCEETVIGNRIYEYLSICIWDDDNIELAHSVCKQLILLLQKAKENKIDYFDQDVIPDFDVDDIYDPYFNIYMIIQVIVSGVWGDSRKNEFLEYLVSSARYLVKRSYDVHPDVRLASNLLDFVIAMKFPLNGNEQIYDEVISFHKLHDEEDLSCSEDDYLSDFEQLLVNLCSDKTSIEWLLSSLERHHAEKYEAKFLMMYFKEFKIPIDGNEKRYGRLVSLESYYSGEDLVWHRKLWRKISGDKTEVFQFPGDTAKLFCKRTITSFPGRASDYHNADFRFRMDSDDPDKVVFESKKDTGFFKENIKGRQLKVILVLLDEKYYKNGISRLDLWREVYGKNKSYKKNSIEALIKDIRHQLGKDFIKTEIRERGEEPIYYISPHFRVLKI